MRRLFPAAILILALCACGSREVILGPNGQPVETSAAQQTPIGAPPSVSAVPDDVERAIAQARRDAAPRPSKKTRKGRGTVDYGAMGPGSNNTMPLSVRLNTTCAMPGQTMQATATTLEGSKLAFAAAYSDNDFVPNFTYVPGEGNPTGTFTWTWQLSPTTPKGDAVVTVVAAKDDKGASYKAGFRVSDSC